jgi:hypothetical protein
MAQVAPLRGTIAAVVLLGIEKTDHVATARHERKAQLRKVVLPTADGASLVEPRLPVENQAAAARTRKFALSEHALLNEPAFERVMRAKGP